MNSESVYVEVSCGSSDALTMTDSKKSVRQKTI